VSRGLALFTTAGDAGAASPSEPYSGENWRGWWSDPDNDRWLNSAGTDETLGSFCGALMGVRWSDLGLPRTAAVSLADSANLGVGAVRAYGDVFFNEGSYGPTQDGRMGS
jgi:hypothetical protein